MSTKIRPGCLNATKNKDGLECSKCHKFYDTLCANITDKRLRVMNTEQRNTWRCPDCVNKLPKGNNSPSPSHANVTMRNKSIFTQNQDPLTDDSTSNIELPSDNLKELIRQEIKNAVKEAVADQFIIINDLVSSFQQSLSFFNDQFENIHV
ncbi:unnamed protein product [Danaus chrysippus]|uniref:(African queen) hypothetical protein n=1 Tax=Danaus chrysippus TaxID=151541 RepID=A0A8J2QMJ0_9NEOP|nr:unnamed protein product [Danaus chrysippus]